MERQFEDHQKNNQQPTPTEVSDVAKRFHKPGVQMRNIIRKFAFATRLGSAGRENQDTFILAPNLQQKSALHFFAVCDGYGLMGGRVSNFVRQRLPKLIGEVDLSTDPYR